MVKDGPLICIFESLTSPRKRGLKLREDRECPDCAAHLFGDGQTRIPDDDARKGKQGYVGILKINGP